MHAALPQAPPRYGYRHEAFFYAGDDEFLARVVPFLRDAVAADEPTLVVLRAEKLELVRGALGGAADGLQLADMEEVGTSPARIIPAWRDFLGRYAADGWPVRGIGEPIWVGRSADELVESERHEELLNLALPGMPDFWLLCPYDVTALPPEVLAEARRGHAVVGDGGGSRASDHFHWRTDLGVPFDRPLPAPPASATELPVARSSLRDIRRSVAVEAADAGMLPDRVADLVLAVNELTTSSVRHSGGTGTLRMWLERDALVCDIRDPGQIDDPPAGRVEASPDAVGGRGLWMANQLCELVQIRSFADGGAVRVHKRLR